MDYEPTTYWEGLHEEPSLRGVGQSGLPEELNRWLYKIGQRNVLRFLERQATLSPPPALVYDVGAGIGYWADLWYRLGASRVDGCDLVPKAVERLRVRFPASHFSVGDISVPGVIPIDGSYDLVTVMNVLLHIIDDDRFYQGARNAAAIVRPGGSLLLAEPVLMRPWHGLPVGPDASSRARTLQEYRQPFEDAGLDLLAVEASTVVGANPIDVAGAVRLRAAMGAWRVVTLIAARGPRAANLIGRGLDVIDRPLMRTGLAPSGKLVLFRRPESSRGH
jgi:SAM-dependent methyltransferase